MADVTTERASVLIVEDEATVAKDIQRTVQALGYRVVAIVGSGRAALEVVGETRPNLVLSDIGLKGDVDGIDLAIAIREQFGTPVVFLSSYSDESTLSRIAATGSYGYLMKPFRAPELRASLALAFRRLELDVKMQQEALTDELTGLHNRRGFHVLAEQHLKVASRAAQRVMLVFADLNGMKVVNDTHGHEAGDRLLIDAARALRRAFRRSDIVARFGGDEFVVLLVDPDLSAPQVIERRVHASVQELNSCTDRRSCPVSISLGVCIWKPEVHRSLGDLLADADAKMYEAKAARRLAART
jgi:diguanylate cyclase (GGDEF)-like protein